MHKILLSTSLALALAVLAAHADLIELRDGQKLNGTMTRQGDTVTIKTDDGRAITAKPDDIVKVTLTGSISPAEAAAAEWTRVNQQIKSADDMQMILAAHKGYLEKFPQAANVDDVRTSLGVYQKLADSNPVKFRGRWVPRAQIDVIMRDWADKARASVEFYKAGHYKDALDFAKTAIDADKDNPNALTIAGLAAYRLKNLALSRTYFTALVIADPGSPLAENNLGVISFQQKQYGEGISHYGKALQISPGHRLVLDNIIEAANAYLANGGDKNAVGLKTLQRQFDAAEKQMEEALGKQGLVRRGSTWVTKEQADHLNADLQTLKNQYSKLEVQYLAAKASVAQVETFIRQVEADYDAAIVAILMLNDQISAAQLHGNGNLMLNLFASRDLTVANANRLEVQRSTYLMQRDQVIAASHDLLTQGEQLQAAIIAGTVRLGGTQYLMDLGEADNPPAPAALP